MAWDLCKGAWRVPRSASNAARQLKIILGRQCGDSRDSIRLVKVNEKIDRYVALSYSWGQALALTTTRYTLPQRINSISFGQLPQTVRDVVLITRAPQIRYIWTDALAIVHDDEDDENAEAIKMASIYHNAVVTLSFTTSANVGECCLTHKSRRASKMLPFKI